MRFAALLFLFWALLVLPAAGAVEGVQVSLVGGEVVGKSYGAGTATVSARVSNISGRTIEGLRLAAWYSAVDVLPTTDAQWRIHEFVFEPALAAGGVSNLTFSDDNAAQYVLLEARAAKFRPALRYDGATQDLQHPLLQRGGATYIALRDLIDVTGGRVGSREGAIVVERFGNVIRLTPGSPQARVDGAPKVLANPVVEELGRSYLALTDAAALLNMEAADLGADLWELK